MLFKLIFVSLLLAYALADTETEKLFKDTGIVPDVLDEAPKETLKIEYAGGLITGNGNEYTPTQIYDEPLLDWPSADSSSLYTIYMGSPDSPSRANPKWGEFIHWLVVNVPGKDISKGFTICPYVGSLAPKKSGYLRYAFIVYPQKDKLITDETILNNTVLDGHLNFKLRKFVAKYKLDKPLAGNVFKAKWDEIIPKVHKQFGLTIDEE